MWIFDPRDIAKLDIEIVNGDTSIEKIFRYKRLIEESEDVSDHRTQDEE